MRVASLVLSAIAIILSIASLVIAALRHAA